MRRPDIGYGGEAFRASMEKLSEYYLQCHAAVCCNTFDGNRYLTDLAEEVQVRFRAAGFEIPHLKLLAWEPEGDFCKRIFWEPGARWKSAAVRPSLYRRGCDPQCQRRLSPGDPGFSDYGNPGGDLRPVSAGTGRF